MCGMKSIQLHPLVLLGGGAIAVLAVVSLAQSPQPFTPVVSTRPPQLIVHPRDYVQIIEGMPYTVPIGKLFVPTALGMSIRTGSGSVQLRVSGQYVCSNDAASGSTGTQPSMLEVPRGLSIPAGSLVEVLGGQPGYPAQTWGYLTDQ